MNRKLKKAMQELSIMAITLPEFEVRILAKLLEPDCDEKKLIGLRNLYRLWVEMTKEGEEKVKVLKPKSKDWVKIWNSLNIGDHDD